MAMAVAILCTRTSCTLTTLAQPPWPRWTFLLTPWSAVQCQLSSATYNNCFSHAAVPWKDLYFASDDKGLWVPCATQVAKGYLA